METKNAPTMLVLDDLWSQGYGMVPRSVMRDPHLSIGAKAVYAYLCAADGGKHPCTEDAIIKDLKLDIDSFTDAFTELKGYLSAIGHPLTIKRMVA